MTYLHRNINIGITLRGEELRIHGFNDANYPTTYPNGCRATSGYLGFRVSNPKTLNPYSLWCGVAVIACSRLQPLVTLPTTEA
jgi:hypothetical protein